METEYLTHAFAVLYADYISRIPTLVKELNYCALDELDLLADRVTESMTESRSRHAKDQYSKWSCRTRNWTTQAPQLT